MLFDPNMPPYCDQAAEYSYLAKAAFGPFATVNKSTTLYGIQAMIHMTQYSQLSDWEAIGSNTAWTYVGAAIRIGLSVRFANSVVEVVLIADIVDWASYVLLL